MITPDTPTDPQHRQTLIQPSLTFLEDWDILDMQPGGVDWLGWQPETPESLFKDGAPEALFFQKILDHDRLSSRWSKIVGDDRSTWLHALIDAANEHPKSTLLRQAMDRLAHRVPEVGQSPLNSGGDNWGDEGVAERMLAHFAIHPRQDARGKQQLLPSRLQLCLKEVANDVGPLERLDACGHGDGAERRRLLAMGAKPAKAEIVRRVKTPASDSYLGNDFAGAVAKITQEIAKGDMKEVYSTPTVRLPLAISYTLQVLLHQSVAPEFLEKYVATPHSANRRHRALIKYDKEVLRTPLWLASQFFNSKAAPKIDYLLSLGSDPTSKQGVFKETPFHLVAASDGGVGEVFESARRAALTSMAQANSKVWTFTDSMHQTALMRVIRKKDADLAHWMIETGPVAQLSVRDTLGHGLPHAIIQSFPPDKALGLLDTLGKINWKLKNQFGETPLDQVARRPADELVGWEKVAAKFGQSLPEEVSVFDGYSVKVVSGRLTLNKGVVRLSQQMHEGDVLIQDEEVSSILERGKARDRDRTITWRPR